LTVANQFIEWRGLNAPMGRRNRKIIHLDDANLLICNKKSPSFEKGKRMVRVGKREAKSQAKNG